MTLDFMEKRHGFQISWDASAAAFVELNLEGANEAQLPKSGNVIMYHIT